MQYNYINMRREEPSVGSMFENGKQPGKLIVAMGLPGSGKSTIFRSLAGMSGAISLHEPEEEDWSVAVHERETCGRFTAITWFRSMRVPELYRADALRKQGRTVFVDSFYDKLIKDWLGKPGMEWLIDKDDPYYDLVSTLAQRDYEKLPEADCIVFFRVTKEVWNTMLQTRSRLLDWHPGFLDSFDTQQYFEDATHKYAGEKGATVLRVIGASLAYQ